MSSGWDKDINVENLSPIERRNYEREERDRIVRESREARGYFEIPAISIEAIRTNFRYYINYRIPDYDALPGIWTVNKTWYICHNCGIIGFKHNEISELFKCYFCRSRNVTVCKAGDISMAVRSLDLGVNMQDVFTRRRERLRRRNG